MRKVGVLLGFILVVLSCGPRKGGVVFDLKNESPYSVPNEAFFVKDYMAAEADDRIDVEDGWTRLTKANTRLGVYPKSTLYFSLPEIRPLRLFLAFTPVTSSRRTARSVAVTINGREAKRIDLNAVPTTKVSQVVFPPDLLVAGVNRLEFLYGLDPDTAALPPVPGEPRRLSSVAFSELLLTTADSRRQLKRLIDREKRLINIPTEVFYQRWPGRRDFYLELGPGSTFEGSFRFISYEENNDPGSSKDLRITLKTLDGREHRVFPDRARAASPQSSIRVDLADYPGPVRLRFQAGSEDASAPPLGVLAWSEAVIRSDPSDTAGRRNDRMEARLESLRNSLSTKNTILVILDSARADHFSYSGYFRQTTPKIDVFSEQAAVFTQAFSQSLSTRTSMATLFTGYPLAVTGFSSFSSPLPEGLPTLAEMFQASGFKTTGYTGVGNTGSVFNFHRGFDEYFELYREDGFRRKSQEYLPYLLPWLDAQKDRRFFLYVHFKEPHAVYIPLPPFQGLFSGALPEKADLANFVRLAGSLTDGQTDYIRACYDETLASADAVFGSLVEILDRLDLLEQSLIILTSDHGEMLGEKDKIFSHGESFAEGGIHIPLLIRLPAGSAASGPKTIDALVKTSDIFMTLADIYGFSLGTAEIMDGQSLLPLLLEPDNIEVNSQIYIEQLGAGAYACRTNRYKLIVHPTRFKTELYDLIADPGELEDIAAREDVLTGLLKRRLAGWRDAQKAIRLHLLQGQDPSKEIDPSRIDPQTLDNLKALGYIK